MHRELRARARAHSRREGGMCTECVHVNIKECTAMIIMREMRDTRDKGLRCTCLISQMDSSDLGLRHYLSSYSSSDNSGDIAIYIRGPFPL